VRLLALAATLALVGCGGRFHLTSTPEKEVAWGPPVNTSPAAGDGNPSVPYCAGARINCKDHMQLLDLTVGSSYACTLAATSCVAPGAADSFEIRVSGYDGDGNLLLSPWAPVLSPTVAASRLIQ